MKEKNKISEKMTFVCLVRVWLERTRTKMRERERTKENRALQFLIFFCRLVEKMREITWVTNASVGSGSGLGSD